jgi:hypothetical protein
MKHIIIIVITITILYIGYSLKKSNKIENFETKKKKVSFSDNNIIYNIENRDGYTYISDLTPNTKNCCLIEKKYDIDSKSIYNGNFKYIYKKLKDDKCYYDLYNLDNNKQLMIEGINGWSNNNCSNEALDKVGSCRNMNFECIDFVNKAFCDDKKMTWSELTCNNSLPYSLDNPNLPINKEPRPVYGSKDGSYHLF